MISLMRCAGSTDDPIATSAASLVPRAMTQQPLKPCLTMSLAALKPLVSPGSVSTMELAPTMLVTTFLTPTSWYWATSRWLGLAR